MAEIKIQSFLILEQSLTKRLVATWRKFSLGLFTRIQRAIAKEDWTKVEILIDEINFSRVLSSNKRFMEFIGRGAFLFGVGRHGEIKDSKFVKDKERIPFLTDASENLQKIIAEQGDVFVKNNIRRAVATIKTRIEAEKITKEESSVLVQKAPKVRTNAQLLKNSIDGRTDQYLENVSSLHNSRLAGWGYVQEAEALGITTYRVSEQIDSDTICPICISMHGKEFQVSEARSTLEGRLTVDNLNDLKHMAPFPNQSKAGVQRFRNLSNPDLVSGGFHVPPYHPRCRGLLVQSTDTANLGPLPAKARRRIPKPAPLPVQPTVVRNIPGLDKIDSDEVRRLFPSLVGNPSAARRALTKQRTSEQLLSSIDIADQERLARKLRGRSVAVQARIQAEFVSVKSDPLLVSNIEKVAEKYAEANMNPAVLREAPLSRFAVGRENSSRRGRGRLGSYDFGKTDTNKRDLFLLHASDNETLVHELGHHWDFSYGAALNAFTPTRKKFRNFVGMSDDLKGSVAGFQLEMKESTKIVKREAKKSGINFSVKNQSHINAVDDLSFDVTKSPSGYALTNDREWIAEGSRMYYGGAASRNKLKEVLPKTFDFIDKLNSGAFVNP